MIDNYKDKKLSEYLQPNGKYLIRFGHGLGDTIMFMPVFEELKSLYPDSTIQLYLESGQENIFESHTDDGTYDEIFHLDFPMVEGENGTKAEKCCREEIGIEYITGDRRPLQRESNPFVAVHFQGTALPNGVNCPTEIAQNIWQEILKSGKIPIECHFEHMFHNPVNTRYPFISRHVRDVPPDLHKLIGLIQHCSAFIGVASGPFIVAMSMMPERTMYLEKHHKLSSYTHQDITKCNILNYTQGSIALWLKQI